MFAWKLMSLALIIAAASLSTADPDMNNSSAGEEIRIPTPGDVKVFVKIQSEGGKLMISSSEDFRDDNTLTVQLSRLIEAGKYQDSGEEIVDFKNRTFNTFTSQLYVFSQLLEGVNYYGTSSKVNQISMSTDIQAQGEGPVLGRVVLTVFIFQDDALLNLDGEIMQALPGTVKFNVLVEKYDFCMAGVGDCEGTGEELKLEFEVKPLNDGKVEKASKRREGDSVDAWHTGGKSAMRLSRKVRVDGEWQDMQSEPEFMTEDSKTFLRLTLPKFNNTLLYDPTVDADLDSWGVRVDTGIEGSVDWESGAAGLSLYHSIVLLVTSVLSRLCV